MKDLGLLTLGSWCRAKATESDRPEEERSLFAQIADEIDGYLGVHDATEPGLFDR
jgi:hypothetical protein